MKNTKEIILKILASSVLGFWGLLLIFVSIFWITIAFAEPVPNCCVVFRDTHFPVKIESEKINPVVSRNLKKSIPTDMTILPDNESYTLSIIYPNSLEIAIDPMQAILDRSSTIIFKTQY